MDNAFISLFSVIVARTSEGYQGCLWVADLASYMSFFIYSHYYYQVFGIKYNASRPKLTISVDC